MACTDCFLGHAHSGEPRGRVITLHGLETYAVEPPDGRAAKGVVVMIPDAFGMPFINNRLLADTYADKGGYRVYLPDFMRGRSCPGYLLDAMAVLTSPGNYISKLYHVFWGAYAFIPWYYHNRPAHTFPTVHAFFLALRAALPPNLPLAVAGFCWGGKHTITLAQHHHPNDDTRSLLDAAFVGHPSFLSLPGDIAALRDDVSIFFAVPERDHQLRVPRDTDVVRAMVEGDGGKEGRVKLYPGCAHGFCTRADPLSGDVARQAMEAEDDAIAWFDAQLRR